MAPHNLFRLPTDVAISPAAPVSTAYGEHAIRYANNIRVEQDEDIPKTTYETLTDELVDNRGAFVPTATEDKDYVEVITSVPEMEDEGSELAVEERAEQEDGESRSAEEENAVESAVGETAKQEQGVDESAIGNNTNGGLESTPGTSSAQLADTIHKGRGGIAKGGGYTGGAVGRGTRRNSILAFIGMTLPLLGQMANHP